MKLFERPRVAPLAGLLVLALAASAPAQESRYDDFKKRFAQAMSINDRDEAAKVVRSYQSEAVVHADVLCTQIATETSEALEKEVDFLNKAWQDALDTKFVEKHYTYLSLIDPATFRERERLRKAYLIQNAKYFENLAGAKDGPVFERVGGEMRALGGAFEKVGDGYLAGEAWMIYGLCFDEQQRGRKDADKRKVTEGFGKMVENWDRIGLQHSQYKSIRQVYDRLVAEGWADIVDDPDAPPPGAPKAADAALAVELSFEAIDSVDAFERPNYFLDDMYQMWPSLYFRGRDGASASFDAIERGPLVLRNSASALEVDFDRDGKGEKEVKLTGKQTVVECELFGDGPQRKWAFLAATGIEQDKYQGLQVNLQPEDAQMSLYYVSAASMVGTLADQPIRVIDDNGDGIYGSAPRALAYVGLAEGNYQPDVDSVVIGTSKRAVPWSEFLKVGDAWYRMESVNHGVALRATPMEVETGTLKLQYKGPPVEWMIVRGEATLENSFFDLMADKGGIEVPAGTYTLYVGMVAKGKKQQRMKALVLPGPSTPSWEVEPGGETVVELGAPFGFQFMTHKSGEAVTVAGKSVTIVGSAGELYERPWNCAPEPEASIRKAGSKKGSKPEDMPMVLDLNEMRDGRLVYTYGDVWRPLDLSLEWKKDDPYQVQLVEKKNKLFGKIESEWQ